MRKISVILLFCFLNANALALQIPAIVAMHSGTNVATHSGMIVAMYSGARLPPSCRSEATLVLMT